MLRARVITGLIGAIVAIGVVWLGGWWLTAMVVLLALLAMWEYRRLLFHLQIHASFLVMAAVVLLLICGAQIGKSTLFLAVFPALLPVLFAISLFVKRTNDFLSLFFTIGGALYIGVGFASLVLLRRADTWVWHTPVANLGLFMVFFALVGTWLSDIGAFFVGRRFGKHPLAPEISPNKTWEGFWGGVVLTVFGLTSYAYWYDFPLGSAVLLGLLLAFSAPAGDLFESMLKRFAKEKDSGQILPGHGGILDRFDSLLFVAPVMVSAILLLLERL